MGTGRGGEGRGGHSPRTKKRKRKTVTVSYRPDRARVDPSVPVYGESLQHVHHALPQTRAHGPLFFCACVDMRSGAGDEACGKRGMATAQEEQRWREEGRRQRSDA